MIFDLAKDLYLVFISGFISLTFFRYRRKKSFTKINGEKYVMVLLAYGALSYFSYLVVLSLLKTLPFTRTFSDEFKSILVMLFFASSGGFWGYLFSKTCFLKIFTAETSLLKEKGVQPETSGLVEMDFVETIKEIPRHEIYVFDLSSRKIYVGFLLIADIDDNMPTEEKVIKVVPLKSGYRRSEDLEVRYNTYYVEDKDIKTLMNDDAGEDSLSRVLEHIASISPVTIFQRELLTYRKYNTTLNEKFFPEQQDIDF